MSRENEAQFIDAATLVNEDGHGGVRWGGASDDLNVTLLAWPEGGGVAPHLNAEVDVVLIVVEGAGEIVVDGRTFPLAAGQALLIPKGCERAIRGTSERFGYLSVHRRRPGVTLSVGGRPSPR